MHATKFKKVKGLYKGKAEVEIIFSEDMLKTFASGSKLVHHVDALIEELRSDILERISILYDEEGIEE